MDGAQAVILHVEQYLQLEAGGSVANRASRRAWEKVKKKVGTQVEWLQNSLEETGQEVKVSWRNSGEGFLSSECFKSASLHHRLCQASSLTLLCMRRRKS